MNAGLSKVSEWKLINFICNLRIHQIPSLLLYLVCAFVFLFLVAPIFVVVPISFSSAKFLQFPPPGFSLQWYENYFGSQEWMSATWISFQTAFLTSLLATCLGTIMAFAVIRGKFLGKNFIYALGVSPMIIPHIISAIAIYFFFSRLHLVGTIPGIVAAHTILAIPFVLVLVITTLKRFDETLERASLSLGASPLKTFWYVTLPIIRPGVVSGALLAFIVSFDEVIVVIFIAGTKAVTLPKRMWDGIRLEIDPTIAAVAALLIALSIFTMVGLSFLKKD